MKRFFFYYLLFGIMVLFLYNQSPAKNSVSRRAFSYYSDKDVHVSLLQNYLDTYQYPRAYEELALLDRLGYGNSDDILPLRRKYFVETGALRDMEDELGYWKQFLARYHGYRDGWLELSRIQYQHYDSIEARSSLVNAFRIDPLFPLVKQYDVYYQ